MVSDTLRINHIVCSGKDVKDKTLKPYSNTFLSKVMKEMEICLDFLYLFSEILVFLSFTVVNIVNSKKM